MKMNMRKVVLGLSLLLSIFKGGLYAADAFTPEEAALALDQLSLQTQSNLQCERALVIQEVQARLKKGEEPQKLVKNVKSFIKKMKNISDSDKDALLAGLEGIIAESKEQLLAVLPVVAGASLAATQGVVQPFSGYMINLDNILIRMSFPTIFLDDSHFESTYLVVEQGCAEINAGEHGFMVPLCPCIAVVAASRSNKTFIAHVRSSDGLSDLFNKMKEFNDQNYIAEIKMYSFAHSLSKKVKWQKSIMNSVAKEFPEHVVYGEIFKFEKSELAKFKDQEFAEEMAKIILVRHDGVMFHTSVNVFANKYNIAPTVWENFVSSVQRSVWKSNNDLTFNNSKIPLSLLSNLKKQNT